MRKVTMVTCFLVLAVAFTGRAQSEKAVASRNSRAYFTSQQAVAGKQQYSQSCSHCHLPSMKGTTTIPALISDAFLSDYYSVGDLFTKVSYSMPGDNAHGLSTAAYVNVVAYLLQSNGFPAGNEPLKADPKAMTMLLRPEVKPATAKPGVKVASAAYYTDAQAERGKGYFHGSCYLCHTVDQNTPSSEPQAGRGVWLGENRQLFRLGGKTFLERWGAVGALYDKVHTTMPAYDAGALGKQSYLDIVAYLLKSSGLPAGSEELRDDRNLMRNMTLEPGFARAFNGVNLDGMGFVIGNNCAPRPEGCAQTEPGDTFTVVDGTIHTSGAPHGYMYIDKKYLNFTLRLDFRFKAYADSEGDETFNGNSGYLLFINKHQVWPTCIEVQGMNNAVLNAFGVGAKVKATDDPQARKRALRPVGQWNSVEIVSMDGQVHSYLNGTLVNTVTEHEFKEPGFIGFQSEGAQIDWRNIRIREE